MEVTPAAAPQGMSMLSERLAPMGAGASDASPGVPGGLRADLGLQLSAGQCNNNNKNHGDNDNKVIMVMMMSLQQAAV